VQRDVLVGLRVIQHTALVVTIGESMEDQTNEVGDGALAGSENPRDHVDSDVESGALPVEISSTRTSRAWIRLLPVLVVAIVILVFVFQNPKDVRVSLFTFSRTLPLSVALLGAVILGALMALALGSMRILQLRKLVHRRNERSKGNNRRRSGTTR